MEQQKVVIRVAKTNRNHHIWLNNGTWWVAYTVHRPDYTKVRVRQSLRTKCADTARFERDRLFRRLNTDAEVSLAA
jgi:hypothetical protein